MDYKKPSHSIISELVDSWDNSYRLSWTSYFMAITHLISSRSPSKRLKVGATIVKNKRIISTGYNGYLPNIPHISIMRDGHEQNTIHAEQNAISYAARSSCNIDGATMYITHFPCIHCTKSIVSSGIKYVYYAKDYRNDDLVVQIMNQAKVTLSKLEN